MKTISDNKWEITSELLRLCQDLIAPGSQITSLSLNGNSIKENVLNKIYSQIAKNRVRLAKEEVIEVDDRKEYRGFV